MYESVTLKSSSSRASRKNNDDKAQCLIKKHNENIIIVFLKCVFK